MEFNGINNQNAKTGEVKTKAYSMPAKEKTGSEEKQAFARTPNNPSYWQQAIGISFKGKVKPDIEDIRKKMYDILEYRAFAATENKNARAFADIWLELCPDTSLDTAANASSYIIPFLSYPKFDFETNKNFLTDVLSNENYSTEEKLEYLNVMVYQKLDKEDRKTADIVNSEMDSYFNFKKSMQNDETAQDLIEKFDLKTGQVSAIGNILQSGKLTPEDFKTFFKTSRGRNISEEEYINNILSSLNSHIDDEDDTFFEYFKNLISPDISICPLKFSTLDSLIEENSPVKKEAAKSLCVCTRGQLQAAIFDDEGLFEIFNSINEDNIEDFQKAIQDRSLTDFTGHKYVNPKTGLFDINMQKYEKELEKRSKDMPDEIVLMPANVYPTVRESVDMQTGEISPIARKFVDEYCFHKSTFLKSAGRKISNSLRSNTTKTPVKKQEDFENNMWTFLKSLKNKDGHFSKTNYKYMQELLERPAVWALSLASPAEELCNFFDETKDENGEVSKELFNFGLDVVDKTERYDTASEVLRTYKQKGADNSKFILASLQDIYDNIGYSNKTKVYENFIPVANACFDENGFCNQERMVFAADLLKQFPRFDLNEKILTVGDDETQKNFIFELLKRGKMDSQTLHSLELLYHNHGSDNETKLGPFMREKLLEYADTKARLFHFSDVFEACLQDDKEYDDFDNETYEKVIDLLSASPDILNTSFVRDIMVPFIKNGHIPENTDFKSKTMILRTLSALAEKMDSGEVKNSKISRDFIDKIIADVDRSLSVTDISIPTDKKDIKTFINDCLGSVTVEENGLTHFENVIKDSIPIMENMKKGLEISYPREEFLADLNAIADDEEKVSILSEKTGANFCFDKEITGWEGIIAPDKLDRNDEFQNKAYEICRKFLYENKSISGNSEFDNEINKIIKACPEFINTIGKKQHGTHKYSLDIHQLLVLAYSIDDPNYKKLNPLDKTMLKTACIFHDIAKQENVIDKGHQDPSAIYTRSIIKKFFKNPETRDRVYELVKNHHWLEQYSTGKKSPEETAYCFRRPNDFDIAKIMAKSDLMAVSDSFYERFKENLEPSKLAPVEEKLNRFYSTGCMLLPSRIVDFSKFSANKETKNGVQYSVVNFNEIDKNEDMGKYGFEHGLKKDDLKLLVHMVSADSIQQDLKTAKLLTSPTNGGVLSESLITPRYKRTYQDRKYGVMLSQINPNIVNINNFNQGSGIKKDMNRVLDFVFGYRKNTRENFRNELIKNLGIDEKTVTDDEYADFYKNNLALKTSLSEIVDSKEYILGGKTFTGADLKKAISDYQDKLIDKKELVHNEIVGYTPKIQAVVAKAKNLNEVPKELLDFSHENNLPIVLI
ncbi:MAG: HD domain-containing protein [Candidatus Gastranaerophilales bacterium]|nr:HD domain-containing protein [Candidatus Gastranaerophilales bacterium]